MDELKSPQPPPNAFLSLSLFSVTGSVMDVEMYYVHLPGRESRFCASSSSPLSLSLLANSLEVMSSLARRVTGFTKKIKFIITFQRGVIMQSFDRIPTDTRTRNTSVGRVPVCGNIILSRTDYKLDFSCINTDDKIM